MIRIAIAGGGTGGHLFPGIAIAEAFRNKNPQNKILFISTGNPFEKSVLSKTDFQFQSIPAEGIKGRHFIKQLSSMSKIPFGILQSIRILKRFRPNLIVGIGSYSSGPVITAGWILGIKIVLHEQNILPGITNRILAHFAERIYVSFPNCKAGLKAEKVYYTGNPVRKEILKISSKPASDIKRPFTILIIGGSQGAHAINMAIIAAMENLKHKNCFYFIHQTGALDESRVQDAYQRHGIACRVQAFFNDMEKQYANADLIICRAGATTVAEVTAIGKAVIFIPYPFAADNHQALNARVLARAGAAEMILQKDLNAKDLARKIEHYAENPEQLKTMASKIKNFGRPDAAAAIVDDCYKRILSIN
ncbi:MAG: undecaprenyldiphospho-muramoylpentapeptide beta-N-acetylglucosaminyltransferase [Desulfobacterales bacterium]|nr:undecaprenyldiphospho-muramoylpentapeptide beta-N-acetylglucosaminyltransferase [Desulfobacterales bacterium]